MTDRNAYMKKYVADSITIICECGGKYRRYNKSLHLKTRKHYIHNMVSMNGKATKSNELEAIYDKIESDEIFFSKSEDTKKDISFKYPALCNLVKIMNFYQSNIFIKFFLFMIKNLISY